MQKNGAVEWFASRISHGGLVSKKQFNELLEEAKKKEIEQYKIDENTSDGYHTFKELYDFRKAYNVALFNEWGSQITKKTAFCKDERGRTMEIVVGESNKYDVHKSWKHFDNELCFGGGWFIVVAILPEGQISNHYKAEDWDLFKIPALEKAKYPFDGHNGIDVINRLLNI